MIKKRDVALETAAELFLTAFNGKIPTMARSKATVEEDAPDPKTRWFRQTFTGLTISNSSVGISRAPPNLAGRLFRSYRKHL